MLPALHLAGALAMPPHARVNSQCYPVWNADRSDLRLVWRGDTYDHGFHAFHVQPDRHWSTCWADACVQRLWCTDSGAAGWYGHWPEREDVPLAAAWLGHADTTYRTALRAEDGSARTSAAGHGAVAVAGSTLYFYTFAYSAGVATAQGLPRLSSLVFAEWRAGVPGADLVREGLRAHDVLGYGGRYRWLGYASPLYPSGRDAVTLSVENALANGADAAHAWALDAAVAGGRTAALVHYAAADCASVPTASREVATFPGYSCRAPAGTALCAPVAAGRWTWAAAPQTALGWQFAPLPGRFALPSALWLQGTHAPDGRGYRALASSGHTPAVVVAGDALLLPELRVNSACASEWAVVLVRYRMGRWLEPAGATVLGCARTLAVPEADAGEASYAALALKWAPWGADSAAFVATDLAAGEYAGVVLAL